MDASQKAKARATITDEDKVFEWMAKKMKSKFSSTWGTETDPLKAGYLVTVQFEHPQCQYVKGIKRGNLAKDLYAEVGMV